MNKNTAIIKTYNTTPNDIIITKDSDVMNLNGKNVQMATTAEIKIIDSIFLSKQCLEILDVPRTKYNMDSRKKK